MSTTGRNSRWDQGFGRSDQYTFTIPSGADGSSVDPVDLLRNHAFLVLACDDASGIDASTTMSAEVADDDNGAMNPLYQQDGAAEWVSGTLPTSGGFRFILVHAFGAQRLRLVLSKNATADVVIKVYGFDPTLDNV